MAKEEDDARALPQEAQQDLNLDEPGSELPEGEEAEGDREQAHGQERYVGEGLGGMELGKDLEELAIARRRERNAGVAENHRIEGGGGHELDHDGHDQSGDLARGRVGEGAGDKDGRDGAGLLRFLPRMVQADGSLPTWAEDELCPEAFAAVGVDAEALESWYRDRLEYLELNPTWTVPPTILKDDILPKARVNPGYVAKKGLKAIDRNGRNVPLSAVNWNLPARAFPYTLRQDGGGKKAALGRIKFMFPNRFSVYLHDTPSRHLFNRPVRMTSSGCVRVDKPFELAELVLRQPERWDQAKLQQVVDKGKTRSVRLKEPLEVILAYWTAEGLGNGKVRFRSDIYGRDPEALAALDGDPPMTVKLPPDPEPEPEAEPSPDDPPEPAAPIKVEAAPAGEVADNGPIGGTQALAGM